MDEKQIVRVAKILEAWNPLGEAAENINDLEGYYTEAVDIIATIEMSAGKNKVQRAIETVLTQAFTYHLVLQR